MTIADLIKNLKTKDQKAEVEFIICKTDGELVCAKLEKKTADMAKMLQMFGR